MKEIGMRPEDVRLLGLLDDMRTQSDRIPGYSSGGGHSLSLPLCLERARGGTNNNHSSFPLLDAGNGGEASVIREGKAYRGHVYRYEGHGHLGGDCQDPLWSSSGSGMS